MSDRIVYVCWCDDHCQGIWCRKFVGYVCSECHQPVTAINIDRLLRVGMSETNRVMTDEEREAYNRDLMRQLRDTRGLAAAYKQDLAADWLELRIEQMELDEDQ